MPDSDLKPASRLSLGGAGSFLEAVPKAEPEEVRRVWFADVDSGVGLTSFLEAYSMLRDDLIFITGLTFQRIETEPYPDRSALVSRPNT